MREIIVIAALAASAATGAVEAGRACTTFVLRGGENLVFGRNFDYDVTGGVVFVNKRNVAKEAASFDVPAKWVSKYGSVTFNLYGREMPMGGMNEAGLVVENMWLDETLYPPSDTTPTVNALQWIQYQLDNFATVQEVIDHCSKIRITGYGGGRIHYLACDRGGDAAIIEILEGKNVIHRGADLPVVALTNDTYRASMEFLRDLEGKEPPAEPRPNHTSLGRFVWAARGVEAFNGSADASVFPYAFDLLGKVSNEGTQWSIVYDIAGSTIHFRTQVNPVIRVIDVGAFDFSCRKPVLMLHTDAQPGGNVTAAFQPYTYERNRALVFKSFSETAFMKDIPSDVVELIARYPDGLVCSEQPGAGPSESGAPR